jgi:hypothetical protein
LNHAGVSTQRKPNLPDREIDVLVVGNDTSRPETAANLVASDNLPRPLYKKDQELRGLGL